MRYDATEIMPGITEVLAYGAASWWSPLKCRFAPKSGFSRRAREGTLERRENVLEQLQ